MYFETAAWEMDDDVPEDEKKRRLVEVQALQQEITTRKNAGFVGKTFEVLVEGPSRHGGPQLAGRDPYHRVVNLAAPADAAALPGSLVAVRLVEATPHSLIGERIPAKSAHSPPQRVKTGPGSADELKRSAVSGA